MPSAKLHKLALAFIRQAERECAFIGPIATAAQLKRLREEDRARHIKPTGIVHGPASVHSILGNVYVNRK